MKENLNLVFEVDYPNLNMNNKLDWGSYSDFLAVITATIKLVDKNNKTICYLNGMFFDLDYMYEEGVSIFDTFDFYTDALGIYENMFDSNGDIILDTDTLSNNIFYINRLYVEKEHRNKGYASLILNNIENIIRYIFKFKVDYIVLLPQSFEKSDKGIECYNVENLQKLVNFYKKNGFKELNDSSGYLVKIVY